MRNSGFDFSECKFISAEMRFYSYQDFCKNCFAIKRLYEKYLSREGKLFYKWYVYANINVTMQQKNKIWDFINDYASKDELIEIKRS